MEDLVKCPVCHLEVKPSDFFCYNCGKNLKPKPLSTTFSKQLLIYVGSVLLPPMGIIWGIKYLREGGSAAKITGIISIILTLISLTLVLTWTNNFIRTLNEQLNSQFLDIQGF